jgi:hypothetical protein
VSLLRQAAAAGVAIDVVNAMAMDYGGPEPAMGQRAIEAAAHTRAVIADVWPAKSAAQAWRSVAVTVMIGANDDPAEVFSLTDANLLVTDARKNRYGWLSFWSLNRDRPCPAATCSGVAQDTYAYAGRFSRYQG